jgi:hypothetical protein
MKYMLIALNVLFAAAVVHLAWKSSSDPVDFSSKTPAVPHSKVERKKTSLAANSDKRKTVVLDSPELTEKRIAAVLEHNIFETKRVPDAPANRNNQRNQQQIRADMSLVGTYVIGDTLGAIILQRLQGNAQQQLKALQQKEYEQYAAAARVTDPKKKSSGTDDDAEQAGEEANEKPVIIMGNPTISANNVFRQHLKVGDTTVNGYKLEEVTRTSAVLTKNSERIELSLLTPSEAGNIARRPANNNNNNRNNNNNNNRNNNNNNNNNNRNNNNNNRNNNNNNNRNGNNNNRNNNNAWNNNNNNNNRNGNNNNRNNNNNRDGEWF